MKTRKQYMAGECTFREYYSQFATPSLLSFVEGRIGANRIKESTDPYMNDIPLKEWDNMQPEVLAIAGSALAKANESDGVELSDCVCAAKAAARIIKERD